MQSTHTSQSDDLLPIGEAARRLGVSTSTLRSWETEGRIASYRTLGGHRRYPTSAIESLKLTTALAEGGDAA